MSIKSQAQSQLMYMQTNKGKVIGSGVGITAGILYGLSSAKGKWGVVGFAIAGAVVGGIIGAMIDSSSAMQKVSSGDSEKSEFRGYPSRRTVIDRPVPRGYRNRQRTRVRSNQGRR